MSPSDSGSDQAFAWGTLVIILLIVIVVLLVGYFAWWSPSHKDTTVIETPNNNSPQVVPVPEPQGTPSKQPAPQNSQPSGSGG